jgi:hypothetical protein
MRQGGWPHGGLPSMAPWLPGGGGGSSRGLGRTSVSELRRSADDSGAHPLTELLLPPSKITSEN